MEIVNDGWLLKSPPPKRLWRAKWRDRWFVLRSGELPGQYFLEYYTDSTCRRLKGKIDLEECEQIDAGITFAQRKFEYKFMFDIKTPKRVFYLCADTEEVMNKWVEVICQVCGLRVMANEEFDHLASKLSPMNSIMPATDNVFDNRRLLEARLDSSPPPSASSTISGPYIPISECITGRKLQVSTRFPFNDDTHLSLMTNNNPTVPNVVAPRPPNSASALQVLVRNSKMKKDERSLSQATSEDSAIQSPTSKDGNSFFNQTPLTPIIKDNSDVNSITNSRKKSVCNSSVFVPPRPPKPAHLADHSHQNYMNIDSITFANTRSSCSSDKSRSSINSIILPVHKTSISSSDPEPSPLTPGCVKSVTADELNNIVDESSALKCIDVRLNSGNSNKVFLYDNVPLPINKTTDPRISPASLYSNIPQSNGAPTVDRGLKPKKLSDSNPMEISLDGATGGIPIQPSSAPPSVYRSLKPVKKSVEPLTNNLSTKFTLAPVPRSRFQNPNHRKLRAAPSPTPLARMDSESDDDYSPPCFKNDSSYNEQVFFPMNSITRRSSNEIQYLDLDLDSNISQSTPKNGTKAVIMESSVVYKKVDFLKTEAFNKTRQSIEEDRKGQ